MNPHIALQGRNRSNAAALGGKQHWRHAAVVQTRYYSGMGAVRDYRGTAADISC